MNLVENIKESVKAIRSNFVRAALTIALVGIGLASLIGVLTSIDGMKFWFIRQFATMGTNTFRIARVEHKLSGGGPRGAKRSEVNPPISYKEALEFKNRFPAEYGVTSVVAIGGFGVSVQVGNKRSKNDLLLMGTDENYALTSSYEIERGRNISRSDVEMARNVIVIGKKVEDFFFPQADAVGKSVTLFGKSYSIVGVFKEKGMTQMMGGDKILVIPVSTLHRDQPDPQRDYGLSIYHPDPNQLEMLSVEATGVFRSVRKLQPKEPQNFGIMRMDNLLSEVMGQIAVLTFSAIAVAIITLFSAAIGLMNIMLVSVTERTREIGVRKSLGATNRDILGQFLTEAVIICQFGGLLGIILGILIGNIIGALLGTEFLVPWPWVITGIIVCFVVGLVSGIYPAWKASRLDPIESLRHE